MGVCTPTRPAIPRCTLGRLGPYRRRPCGVRSPREVCRSNCRRGPRRDLTPLIDGSVSKWWARRCVHIV